MGSTDATDDHFANTPVILQRELLGPAMRTLYDLIALVAASDMTATVTGETGAGKEVVARTLHALSRRSQGPFMAVNCAGLAPSVIESELFGHERGAFTGANDARRGLFEAANGGTLLLDEIGELPIELQAKLLRVIDEREVLPIGATKARPIQVRFIAATNRDLAVAASQGHFRKDLYYRLNGITLLVPPLRERRTEIPALVRTALNESAKQAGRTCPAQIQPEALELLAAQDWPGNVRQLKNTLCRALLFCVGDSFTREHVLRSLQLETAGLTRTHYAPDERTRIELALIDCAGNQTRAAHALGMGRTTLIAKIQSYAIPRPRGKDARHPPSHQLPSRVVLDTPLPPECVPRRTGRGRSDSVVWDVSKMAGAAR